ncbi:hypothetical protein [Candidatus Marithrix sp. Canyon 246]|uniref:hypothetical protein n=1 Tax=Candidatus Marithrix sp. Canyon 246 TaxID=1827136 RepID=UPI000849F034|nr:hypothetical protein [Candidatus Marithrix sp. Canyon 246]
MSSQLIFVTSGSKTAIENHFDKNQELEDELEQRGKYDLLADDLINGEELPCLSQKDTEKYGIIEPEELYEGVLKINHIIEKPYLENLGKGAGGEIQLTDAIAKLLVEEQVLACQFKGTRYDCGSKLGYLIATVDYALQHPNLSEGFKKHLRNVKKICQ